MDLISPYIHRVMKFKCKVERKRQVRKNLARIRTLVKYYLFFVEIIKLER